MIMLTSQVHEVTRTHMRAVNQQGKNADNVCISHHFTTRSNSCVFSGITEAGQCAHHGVLLALVSAQEPLSKEDFWRPPGSHNHQHPGGGEDLFAAGCQGLGATSKRVPQLGINVGTRVFVEACIGMLNPSCVVRKLQKIAQSQEKTVMHLSADVCGSQV